MLISACLRKPGDKDIMILRARSPPLVSCGFSIGMREAREPEGFVNRWKCSSCVS